MSHNVYKDKEFIKTLSIELNEIILGISSLKFRVNSLHAKALEINKKIMDIIQQDSNITKPEFLPQKFPPITTDYLLKLQNFGTIEGENNV